MRKRGLFLTIPFVLLSLWGFAQTSVDPTPPQPKHYSKFYSPKASKSARSKKTKVTRTAQFEFYKRVERAAKDKQRIMRKLSKPQFSNPTYFGHKSIPKRRSPSRMRLCAECQIRH